MENHIHIANEVPQITRREVERDELKGFPVECLMQIIELLRAPVIRIEAIHANHGYAVPE